MAVATCNQPPHRRRSVVRIIYAKITTAHNLIPGMLSAEGQVHKRMRRVGNPAFSVQNMRALVPLVFSTGQELRDKWFELIGQKEKDVPKSTAQKGVKLDVCMWVSRATFDIIGLAGMSPYVHP